MIELRWLIVVTCAACGRIGFDPRSGESDGGIDDVVVDAEDPSCVHPTRGPFAPPSAIAGVSDPAAFDGNPSLTADSLELYFVSDRTGGAGGADIWLATRNLVSDPWLPPVNVAELNTATVERSPAIAADGLTITLVSDRPGGPGSRDVWTSTRATRQSLWPAPVLDAELSTPFNEDGITVAPSGLITYVESDREGTTRIFRSSRPTGSSFWSVPIRLPEIEGATDEVNPWSSADDCTIAFGSSRAGGPGQQDIYFAERPALKIDPFATPVLDAIVSDGSWDDAPWLSADLRYLVLQSNRVGGGQQFDLYETVR